MPSPFQLFADHPALDLVNTLDNRFAAGGPTELLRDYADLLAFVRQSDLLEAGRINGLADRKNSLAAAQVLHLARELREALAVVFYEGLAHHRKPKQREINTLERHFLQADQQQELRWQSAPAGSGKAPRGAWAWGRAEKRLELPVWVLAQTAARLVTSEAMDQVHMCRSETCRWLFLDSSRNHSRRWCDMKVCGNRMKARRFQARRADDR